MDRIRNERIRGTWQVRCFGDKVREARLRCFVVREDTQTLGIREEDAEDREKDVGGWFAFFP